MVSPALQFGRPTCALPGAQDAEPAPQACPRQDQVRRLRQTGRYADRIRGRGSGDPEPLRGRMRAVGGRGEDEWNTGTLKTVGPYPAASGIPCSHWMMGKISPENFPCGFDVTRAPCYGEKVSESLQKLFFLYRVPNLL